MKKDTDKIELVETHNIALSLQRIHDAPNSYDAWKRVLYHALLMSGRGSHCEIKGVREALGLP